MIALLSRWFLFHSLRISYLTSIGSTHLVR